MLAGHSGEMKLLVAIAGIYVCFITFALNTEGLYSYVSDGGMKFTSTLFFLLVQCITNSLVSGLALLLLPSERHACIPVTPPVLDYITAGFSYISAMLCSTEALKYVSLPLQALGKSCKMVPVMLFGFLIRGRRYTFRETLSVFFITAGISVFQHKKVGSDVDVVGGEHSGYGLVLLFLSLVLDGVTGACQDRMREVYSPTTHQMMFHLNAWATVLLACLVTATGQLTDGITYCHSNPDVVYYIILAALSMAAGQNFIFFTLANFDALTLATITTTRKFFTIIVSTIFYHHHFGEWQKIGVCLVFLGLTLELVNKYEAKQLRKRKQFIKEDTDKKKD